MAAAQKANGHRISVDRSIIVTVPTPSSNQTFCLSLSSILSFALYLSVSQSLLPSFSRHFLDAPPSLPFWAPSLFEYLRSRHRYGHQSRVWKRGLETRF